MSDEKLSPTTTFGLTVGELIDRLKGWPPDAELFLGGLRFYRFKQRGEKLVQIEFQEVVYRTADGEIQAQDT